MMGTEENQSLSDQLKASNEELSAILKIETSALGAESKEEILENVFTSLMDLLKADAVTVLLREDHTLRAYASLGVEEDSVGNYTATYGQEFSGKIAETQKPMYIADAQVDPLVANPYIKNAGIHSILGAPLLVENETIGVIHIDWLKPHPFSEREQHILQAVAERCALTIANASLCEHSSSLRSQMDMYLDIIEHDIENLNQLMINDLQTLASSTSLKVDERQMVKGFMDTVKESETIVDNVRKLDQAIGERLEIETMDLDEVLKASISDALSGEEKNVTVKYTPGQGRAVNGAELIKDAFYSLIRRAVKTAPGPVEIDINVEKAHIDELPIYQVSIADNATGIPEDVKPDLFSFHMGLTEAHGKELPLFIIHLLTERLGGSIIVEDRVPGDYKQGSKFILSLPAIEGQVNPQPEPESLRGKK
jgi:K+-sensing histidine kinase KdpD